MRIYILLVGLLLPFAAHAQCKALRKKKEKSTGKLTITTDPKEPVSLSKVLQGETTTYYLRISAPASATGDKKGVFIMVSDKTLYKWPEETIAVQAERNRSWRDNSFTATSTLVLTADQLQSFATYRINDYELGEFEWTVNEGSGELFRRQVGCLVNAKPKKNKK